MPGAIVEQFLDATQNHDLLPEVLRRTAERYGSDHAFAIFVSPEKTSAFSSRDSSTVFADFMERLQFRNPHIQQSIALARSPEAEVQTGWSPFTREEIAQNPFEPAFAASHHGAHYAGALIPCSESSYVAISLERGASKGIYASSEMDDVNRFIETLGASMKYALKAQARLTAGLVDSMSHEGTAKAWLGGNGHLVHPSQQFQALIGRFVELHDGRIRAAGDADERLQWLLKRTARGERTDVTVRLESMDGQTALAHAVPMHTISRSFSVDADLLLTIVLEQPRKRISSTLLRQRFNFTEAEARLALRLAEGQSLREAAKGERISFETARTRLKVIFHKSATTRQIELILLLKSLAG
ncbi:helix-turn-helix transcriptional regulator [Oryzicola mucosus]|uniref:HTH luxR-type domain-containing protein n=1 Tax=Oryzicola mucosus TaxID=2767425 RepID=A0A8J6TWA9_9HYPH|nr:hypothetical protein [Oryzicola mucosus]MBD0413246.1 hypothetical protein [Oryzicola mucosus]